MANRPTTFYLQCNVSNFLFINSAKVYHICHRRKELNQFSLNSSVFSFLFCKFESSKIQLLFTQKITLFSQVIILFHV